MILPKCNTLEPPLRHATSDEVVRPTAMIAQKAEAEKRKPGAQQSCYDFFERRIRVLLQTAKSN